MFDIIGCAKRCLSFATNGNSGGGVASDSEKLKVTVKVDNVVHLCCFSIILGFILVKTKAEKPSSGGLNSSSGNGNGGGSSVNLARYLAFARDTQCCALSWLVQILPQWSKDKKVMIKYMRQVLMLVKPEIIDGNALTDSEKKVGLVIFDKKSPTAFPVSEQLLSAIAVLIRECSSTPSALSENFRILESVALRGLESLGPESKAVLPPVFSDPQGLVQELFSLARVREHGEFYDADTVWSCAVLMVVLAAIDTGSFGWYVWENVPSVAVLMEMILTDNWGGRPLVSRHAVGPSEAELEAADRAERTRLPAEVTAERTLILFDPQQQRSRPTDEAVKNVENIVARHPLVKGRLLGKKEFFEGILEGQSMEGLMLWLPELIHKDGEMAAALPSKLLCELLLSPLFCDPERTHCVRRVQAWAGSKDQAQQAESVEVFMFFLRCLGSPHCHMREHARAALMEIFGSLEGVVRAEVLTSSAQRLLDACMRIADAIGVETRPEVIAKYIELLAECRSVFPVQDTLHRFCLTLASRPLLRKVLLDNDENEEGSALLQRTAEALITLCFKSCGSMVSTEALAGISLFFGVSKRPHTDALDPGILENLFGERGWLSIFSVRDLVLMWAESEDPVVCAAGVSRLEHEDLVSLICTPGYTKQTVSLAVETLAKSGPLQKAVYANVAHCLELYGLGDMVKMLAKEDD